MRMVPGYLQDKNIVIIGGTTGLGLSAAKAFVISGANVIVVGVDSDSCASAVTELGKTAVVLQLDATNPNTADVAISTCISSFGNFSGLYHVAGGSGRKFGDGPLHELTLEGWNKTFELNLGSMMLSNQRATKQFLQDGKGGTILNMGSVLSYAPAPVYFSTHAYSASKSAVLGYTKAVAAYYAPQNIRFNVIMPGLVETPMAQRAVGNEDIMNYIKSKQPLDGGRIGKASDLDGLACYFMSEHSSFVTGQAVSVDGGWSVSEGQINH